MVSDINPETDNSDRARLERARLERIVMASPILAPIVRQWAEISLPDCWLVAGAITQTVWNDAFALEPGYGLADVDLVYFDGSDLSEGAEADHAARVRGRFSDLGVKIDVKNEARIHLWYANKFGHEISPYTSARHAITTFPTTATAIGIQPADSRLLISVPFGLTDLFDTVVRPNKVQVTREIYEAKVMRWRPLWPRLKIVDWAD
jgi:hypothetical protein